MPDPLKVLIIDDDISDEILMRRALTKSGVTDIAVARNGPDGIAQISGLESVGVVIVDNMLPGMDGFEVCRQIKSLRKDLKVVICSGAVNGEGEEKARTVGADQYCEKTSDYGVLMDAIKNFLES